MLFRYIKPHGACNPGEVIDVRPADVAELVASGVLVCIEPPAPTATQDRAMQPPPRGSRSRPPGREG